MKKSLHKLLLKSLLLFLVASGTSFGQEEGASDKPAGRLAWFVATQIPDKLENPVKVMSGSKITDTLLSKRAVSAPVKFGQDGIIKVVKAAPDPEDSEKTIYLTLAQARIPDGMTKALVILTPRAKKKGEEIFHCLVQDLAKFNGGDSLYLNLSQLDVAVQLGDKKLALKPGTRKVFVPPSLAKSTSVPVSYHYYHPVQEKWKLLSASTIVMRPTRREICIFSWDPRYERVDYHGVTFPIQVQ
ncbi:hypothetical protein [Roseibacillus persicicus]|uniref:Uncharacterized protein n=1 Tax=Roseibacillus persicicus TaxID=454148 RepID=A0A918TUZ0_9BACT|nr:hypothetical protein [Roseibacillus persicicus]GHC57791.1 hypothetical protein GCM10007100_25800 [Roseibacillus persicicus]